MAFGSVGDAELEGSKLGFDERMSHLYTFFFNDFLLGIIGCYHMVIYGRMVNLDFIFRFTNDLTMKGTTVKICFDLIIYLYQITKNK